MFYALTYLVHLLVLATLAGLLLRVTYPDTCPARRCTEHTAAA